MEARPAPRGPLLTPCFLIKETHSSLSQFVLCSSMDVGNGLAKLAQTTLLLPRVLVFFSFPSSEL
eukprot:717290-Pelagomonas_calceolata.AAC.1